MKIFVGQIYINAGVSFPFSLHFQKWLGDALSKRVQTSEPFSKKFGFDFGLGLRISAKADIDQPEIKGPTVFRRDKNVEFTIFLPYRSTDYHDLEVASQVFEQLLRSTVSILRQLELNTANVLDDICHLQTEFRRTPSLLEARS